eukprot:5576548-Pyramimonas_sp.AAC.1
MQAMLKEQKAASSAKQATPPEPKTDPKKTRTSGPQQQKVLAARACRDDRVRSLRHPSLGVMNITYGSKVSSAQTDNHELLLLKVLKYACKRDVDKAGAVKYRASLL